MTRVRVENGYRGREYRLVDDIDRRSCIALIEVQLGRQEVLDEAVAVAERFAAALPAEAQHRVVMVTALHPEGANAD